MRRNPVSAPVEVFQQPEGLEAMMSHAELMGEIATESHEDICRSIAIQRKLEDAYISFRDAPDEEFTPTDFPSVSIGTVTIDLETGEIL